MRRWFWWNNVPVWVLLWLVAGMPALSHGFVVVGNTGSTVTVDCDDVSGQHLNYDATTGLFTCGVSTQGAQTVSVPNDTATTITALPVTTNTTAALSLWYKVEVWNGTDVQGETGMVTCRVTNKAGTVANNQCTKALNLAPAVTAGTLAVTWTATAANPSLIQVQATSSLTPTATWPKVTYALLDGTSGIGGAPGNAQADGATKGIVAFPATDMVCTSGICALKGTLAPSPLTWNVIAATCINDGNAGKLTVNAANQIICSSDEGTAANVFSNASVSVINELAVFADTSGMTIGRANITGMAKLTAGVLSAATASDFVAPSRSISTTGPLAGGGDFSANRTFTCPTCTTNAASLDANLPVIGGGSNAVAVGSRSGTTTQFATVTGTKTANKQLAFDASGNVIASATDIGSGGGATGDAEADGSTKGIAAFAANDFNAVAGVVSLDYVNGQVATNSVPGFLSASDHASFAAKAAASTLMSPTLPLTGGGDLSANRTLACPTCTTNAAVLTVDLPVIGAGGQATAVGTKSGTGTKFATVSGTLTAGKQATFDASGNVVASSADIGGGGGGGLGDPGASGILARTSTNTTVARSIQGTSGHIAVTAGDGQSANPTMDVGVKVVLTDVVNTFTGSGALTGLPSPTNPTDVAIKAYVDTTAAGLAPHTAARIATTANLNATYSNGSSGLGATLTNAGTQAAFSSDGVTGVLSDRVLVKNQTSAFQNGIYTITTVGTGATNWVLTRATDYDNTAEVLGGSQLLVSAGTVNAGTLWVMTQAGPITLGTSDILFTQLLVAPYTLTLTGDVTGSGSSSITTTLANIPSATPFAGSLLGTNSSAPATPATGKTAVWVDATDKRLHDKSETTGFIGTTVIADTGASNNFLTAISAAGVISKAQPSAANLSNGTSGSGAVALVNTPTLITPVLGVATATTINKVTLTAPASSAILTIADGKTFTASNTLTFTGTDGSSVAFGAGGTAVYTARSISTTAPLAGGGDLSANRTLSIANAVADGSTKGAATFATTDFSDNGAGLISLNYASGQAASGSAKGFLTSTDYTRFDAKQDVITWGAGLSITGATASVVSTEANFLINGNVTDLVAGANNGGKAQVMADGTFQYTDGAATPALHKGHLTQSGLTWNATVASCTGDGNSGKLTVNGSNQIICAPDVGGGTVTPGTNGNVTYYTGSTTIDDSTALTLSGTKILTIDPNVTTATNTDLTLGAHFIVNCDPGSTDRFFDLPSAASSAVGYYKIVKIGSGSGVCKARRNGADTINGAAGTADAVTQWSVVELQRSNSGSPGNWSAVFSTAQPFQPNPQTSNYPVTTADFAAYRTLTASSGSPTYTLPVNTQQPPAGQFIKVINYGPGLVTIVRNGQTINGGTASLLLSAASATAPATAWIVSDGTNYIASVTAPAYQKRVTTLASSTTYTCPADQADQCAMQATMAAGTLTIAAPTGSVTDGQLLMLGFLCTNQQQYAFNSIFIASPNTPLPGACPANVTQWTWLGFRYSSVLTKFQLLAAN